MISWAIKLRLILKSALFGFGLTFAVGAILVYLPHGNIPGKVISVMESFFLPGMFLGFAIGSGNVHSEKFWLLVAGLNGLCYSLPAYVVLLYWQRKKREAKAGHANPS